MHEMSYVIRFVNLAIQTAEENRAKSVKKLTVQVGEMTDIEPSYLQKYYPAAVKDTILEGSSLETEQIKAKIHCNECGREYHPTRDLQYLCPVCGSGNGRILAGRSVVLKNVEIETEDK